MTRVAGIDGYGRGAWVAVVLRDGTFERALVGRSLLDLLPRLEPVDVTTIDIPIGLPERGQRQADVLARSYLGPRWQTVFMTPPRAVLEAPTYEEANRIARSLDGKGISQQAYAIRRRILEADAAVRAGARLIEAHPEVSFGLIAGAPIRASKDSWAGAPLRRRLLAAVGIDLPDDLGEANAVPVDDILDAAAVAWSAARVAAGRHVCLPDPPEAVASGQEAAIRG